MTTHRLSKRTAIVYIASDDCFVQLDRPVVPTQIWFDSYRDIPSDRTILHDRITPTQKEITAAHILRQDPDKLGEVFNIAHTHSLDTNSIYSTYIAHVNDD